jgi:hypothetical protein
MLHIARRTLPIRIATLNAVCRGKTRRKLRHFQTMPRVGIRYRGFFSRAQFFYYGIAGTFGRLPYV